MFFNFILFRVWVAAQLPFTYLKSTIEIPKQRLKYVQNQQTLKTLEQSHFNVVMVTLWLTLNRFYTLSFCFHSWF